MTSQWSEIREPAALSSYFNFLFLIWDTSSKAYADRWRCIHPLISPPEPQLKINYAEGGAEKHFKLRLPRVHEYTDAS